MSAAIERTDLVVTTGGLGPTPDDLTREAVAAALGQEPAVDPELERWLRSMWDRRGLPFPEMNLKQAWLIPAAAALPNPNGTAPGWWVERDNPAEGVDSWQVGAVPIADVVGTVLWRYWPLRRRRR